MSSIAPHRAPRERRRLQKEALGRVFAVWAVTLLLGLLADAALSLSTPPVARAWSCTQVGCPRWQGSIPVRLGALSSDLEALGPGTTRSELERAAHDWALVSCAALAFDGIAPTEAPLWTVDGVSVVGFVESEWPHDPAAIGLTTVEVQSCSRVGGCLVEADTVLNGQHFHWVLQRGALPEVNAYSILLHELGHSLGLGHSASSDAAMNTSYTRGYLVLSADDEVGICSLYPSDEPADCAEQGCPFGQVCVEGVCEPAPPESCVTAMDCASDERCIEATGRCVRRALSSEGLGDACEVDADCASQECAELPEGRQCTLTCDGLDPRSCPAGFYCDASLTDACATGHCVAGDGGSGGFGAPCQEHTDCGSLFCSRGACSIPCDPARTANCPSSYTCHPHPTTGCGACLLPLEVGEPCMVNGQCQSTMCFAEDGHEEGVCTTPCLDASECPDRFRCTAVGDTRLCLPPVASSGCGCTSAGAAGAPARPLAGLAGLLALGWWARRRRSGGCERANSA